jgi:hypothetical protein
VGKIESEECRFDCNEARQTNDVTIGSSQDRSGSESKMGEGEAVGVIQRGISTNLHCNNWTLGRLGDGSGLQPTLSAFILQP